MSLSLIGVTLMLGFGAPPAAAQVVPIPPEGRSAAAPVDPAAGPLERVAVQPTLDRPAPRRTVHVPPVWPDGAASAVKFRVHLVLDAAGRVGEARVLSGGARNARPIVAAEASAVLAAVRRWQFEPPLEAPMLIVTYVGSGDEEGVVMPGASQRPPLRVGGDIGPPSKVQHVIPEYPPEAQAANVSGVVILEVTIDPEGSVTDARVVRSVTGLDEAAIAAVRQWRYTPTWLNGEAVPVLMTVTVNFQPQ